MENNQNQNGVENQTKKKSGLKRKIYFLLALIIVGAIGYGYFWITGTNQIRKEAVLAVEQAEMYKTLREAMGVERDRCANFIARQEGDFGSFEYCKNFIDWNDSVLLNLK